MRHKGVWCASSACHAGAPRAPLSAGCAITHGTPCVSASLARLAVTASSRLCFPRHARQRLYGCLASAIPKGSRRLRSCGLWSGS